MLFKISPRAFTNTSCAWRWCRYCPIAGLWSLPTPDLDVSTLRYLLCLVHFLLHDSPDRIVNKIKVWRVQGHTSGGMKSSVSVHCATARLSCVTLRQVKTSHISCRNYYWTRCFKKLQKISQQVAKLCWKWNWLLFFWDTVYYTSARHNKSNRLSDVVWLKSLQYCKLVFTTQSSTWRQSVFILFTT